MRINTFFRFLLKELAYYGIRLIGYVLVDELLSMEHVVENYVDYNMRSVMLVNKQFPIALKTIRTINIDLQFLPNLKKLMFLQDLPIDYKLSKFTYIRLLSKFYGLNFDSNTVNYNL